MRRCRPGRKLGSAENSTDAWWALTTATTVGYGDVYPHSGVGRIIAGIVMLSGIGFVALLTASAAHDLGVFDFNEGRASAEHDEPGQQSGPGERLG